MHRMVVLVQHRTCVRQCLIALLVMVCVRDKRSVPCAARYEYIKELDRQRGRGQQGAKSPLLWDAGQVEELLQGSPVAKEVGLRLKVLLAMHACVQDALLYLQFSLRIDNMQSSQMPVW